ncbi:MAG: hypothetical protein NTY04_01425 [Candidatus Staskawiczbacteria bacterium]|nr:hypothetical protein [Candidatus Staskawiczbacteria bacterium]
MYNQNFEMKGANKMPSMCPVCGRIKCTHTAEERDQTADEIMRDLTPEEEALRKKEPNGSGKLITVARKNAHLLVV